MKFKISRLSAGIAAFALSLICVDAAQANLPFPNRESVVLQVARDRPDLLRSSCTEHGGNNEFMFEVVRRLRVEDKRWGLNWKRGNVGDLSQDVIDYVYGPAADNYEGRTDVYIIDIIVGHCGSNPQGAWIDVTDATRNGGAIGRWTMVPMGGSPAPGPAPTPTPAPTSASAPNLSAVSPAAINGAAPFTLTFSGQNFAAGSVVEYSTDGGRGYTPAAATYVSPTELRVSASGGVGPGSYLVRVKNLDGRASNAVNLTVQSGSAPPAPVSAPVLSGTTPSTVTSGQPFTITISGSNFAPGAILEGSNDGGRTIHRVPLQFVSPSQVQLSSDGRVGAGIYQIRVKNPDGQASGIGALTVR